MTKHTEVYDAAGNPITGTIMPDGGRVFVRMTMMDAAPADLPDAARRSLADSNADTARHAPGGIALSDADRDTREKLLDARDKRVADAWRNPPPEDQPGAQPAPTADAEARYAARDARLEQAWKGAAA
jgi:hypothetical protein